MIHVRNEVLADIHAREELLDAAMGEGRFRKTSERLRVGRLPARGLSLIAEHEGEVAGTVRLWHVEAGQGRPSLLLGPLAVAPDKQSCGIGGALMRTALQRAAQLGHSSVMLVGDAPYYERFGFSAAPTARLRLPGPYERTRFLAHELVPGALMGAGGLVRPTGLIVPQPDVAAAEIRAAA